MSRNGLTSLIELHRHTAGDKMSRGGEADGTSADDRHGKFGVGCSRTHAGTFVLVFVFDLAEVAGLQQPLSDLSAVPAQQFRVR